MSTIKYAVKDTGALQRRLQTVRHAFYEMRNISSKWKMKDNSFVHLKNALICIYTVLVLFISLKEKYLY